MATRPLALERTGTLGTKKADDDDDEQWDGLRLGFGLPLLSSGGVGNALWQATEDGLVGGWDVTPTVGRGVVGHAALR